MCQHSAALHVFSQVAHPLPGQLAAKVVDGHAARLHAYVLHSPSRRLSSPKLSCQSPVPNDLDVDDKKGVL